MDISSKFSLYDVLAMIIPGTIIMAAIALLCDVDYLHKEITTCCGYRVSINYDLDFMLCIVLLSASYILGLINNWINDCVFCGFRNNLYAIENELMRALSDNENIYLKRYGISWPGLTKPHVKSRCEEIKMVSKDIWKYLFEKKHHENYNVYHKLYYALSERNLLGSIPMIESQVALLRNTVLPITSLVIMLGLKCSPKWFLLFFGVLFIYIVMIQRQNKVYNLIWESANYYKL